jgi:hypothetical protein
LLSQLKVAFVGAGYMAEEHMRAFASLPDVTIAGVHSRTRERAEKLAASYNTQVYDSVSELYNKTGADLVVVTVIELSMAEVASACFDHPWAVLLEKPAGYDLADATRIRDAAARADSRAFVAFNRRAYSSTRQALELLQDDSSQRFIKVVDQQDQQAAILLTKHCPELVARNYMFANSIHLIDYFRVLGRGGRSADPLFTEAEQPGWFTGSTSQAAMSGLYEDLEWSGPRDRPRQRPSSGSKCARSNRSQFSAKVPRRNPARRRW